LSIRVTSSTTPDVLFDCLIACCSKQNYCHGKVLPFAIWMNQNQVSARIYAC
jgi:hypothetical protein